MKNNNVTIYGKCGNFYVISQTNTMFSDGLYTGFIFKSAVIIPPTNLVLDEDEISLEIGESYQLATSFEPDLAYKPNVVFESENPRIARVDASGKVTGVKVGQTSIVAKTVDGKLKAACNVDVTLDEENKAWTENTANKKISTSSSNNKTSKTTKTTSKKASGFQIKVQGIESKKIQITWNKQSGAKKYLIERKSSQKGKLKKIATVKKSKNKYIDKKVKAKKKYWYRVVAKKAKKKNDKKSKVVSGKGKNLNAKFSIELYKVNNEKLKVKIKWKSPQYTKRIILQKKIGNGNYINLQEFSSQKTEYEDGQLNYNITYKYRVLAKRTLGKTLYSNEITYTPTYTVNKTRNLEFFKNNYPFVCRNASQDMNQYSVFSGYYSPIKYKFTGDTLEIHLYFEFTRYDKTGKEVSVEKNKGIGKESYISLFKQGLKKWHATYVVEDKYEFKNINFKVVDVIHDKSDKESYNSNQQFTKVLIGGIDPKGKGLDPWYYTWTGGNSDSTIIYLPYAEDTKRFKSNISKNTYLYISAHEVGHLLGLKDGYITEDGKHDRFSDNSETGFFYKKKKRIIIYDNLMVERGYNVHLHPNDIQMMLAAYSKNNGRPWQKPEAYKTVPELGMTISSEISNHKDYYVEDKQ